MCVEKKLFYCSKMRAKWKKNRRRHLMMVFFNVENGEFVRKRRSAPTPEALRKETPSAPIPLHFISERNMP